MSITRQRARNSGQACEVPTSTLKAHVSLGGASLLAATSECLNLLQSAEAKTDGFGPDQMYAIWRTLLHYNSSM